MFVLMDVAFFESQSYFPKSSLQGEIRDETESWEKFELVVSNPTSSLLSLPIPIMFEPTDTVDE